MNTPAARRQLPRLLQAPPPPLPSPSPRWRRSNSHRAVWTGSRPLVEDPNEKKTKQNGETQQPSIFEEIFPDEDLSTLPYRRDQKQQRDDRDPSSSSSSSSKVRIVTSTHVDKSEMTEWNAMRNAVKTARLVDYRRKKREATSTVANMLGPKQELEPWGPVGSGIPTLGSKPEEAGSASSGTVAKTKEAPSLSDELFKSDDPPKTRTPAVEDRHVDHGDLQAWIDSLPQEEGRGPSPEGRERPAMLILSNASTNLSESDFYRVGPQGQHLDGWGASISKVMQAYDYNTLQPLGRYFILFDSHAAAASYQIEAQRRYNLARHALQSPAAPLAVNSESVAAADAFTLAPLSKAPLSLHLYKLNKANEARLETFSIQGLLSITPDPPPRACSQVILSLEGGTLDQRSLSQLVKRDARDRGLGWPVQHMRPYFPPKVYRRGLADGSEAQEYEWDEDTAPKIIDPEKEARRPMDVTARSALFVLSFPDAHEARRFTRAWHRKELARPRGHSLIVNAHFVW
ncbi:hypothetical protein CkaCkLH20_01046 [Colletotrichum karsti]|uniref:Uncharacterized protein n=1 Tax=Colletotrichum karsti TaxID=1095194 RepID=A0A9P6IFQ0_9PEZI|nr:uncharacterized protein CkaCkLH20_01046 [Colletotrichum karsti]KAF9881900.1 hypothetical protein CkaCkLH20_01046 [Colletotrichum karsti]